MRENTSQLHPHVRTWISSMAHFRRFSTSARAATAAAGAPDFAELASGKTLQELSAVFNAAFTGSVQFPDAASRTAMLMSMRSTYCRKMLEECAIDRDLLELLSDPSYLPPRETVLKAFQLEGATPDPAPTPTPTLVATTPDPSETAYDRNMAAEYAKMQISSALPAESRTFEDNFRLEYGR